MQGESTTELQHWIERMNAGDAAARDALIVHTRTRMVKLVRKMLPGYRAVHDRDGSSDVADNALLRLLKAVKKVRATSAAAFLGLAFLQVRRELLTLAERYEKQRYAEQRYVRSRKKGAKKPRDHSSGDQPDAPDTTQDPQRLTSWSEFHRQVGQLPEEERIIFELRWYGGLTQEAAAAILHISVPTLRKRFMRAKLRLKDYLDGGL